MVPPTSSESFNDQEYIVGVRTGDHSVFTHFVNTYVDSLTIFAYGIVGDEDVSHDIVQEVFARVWQIGQDWKPKRGVRPYLFQAVKNRSLNWLKFQRNQRRLMEVFKRNEHYTAIPAEDIGADEKQHVTYRMIRLIRLEIQTLSERQRIALQLRYEQQLAVKEVAAVMDITVRSTEQLLARALLKIRLKTERLWDELNRDE